MLDSQQKNLLSILSRPKHMYAPCCSLDALSLLLPRRSPPSLPTDTPAPAASHSVSLRHFSALPISEGHQTNRITQLVGEDSWGTHTPCSWLTTTFLRWPNSVLKSFKLPAIVLQLPARSNQYVSTAGYQQRLNASERQQLSAWCP